MKKISKLLVILIIIFSLIAIAICGFFVLFPQKYKNEINLYAKQYNLSPTLIASVINAESKYDANAVSSAGAMGLMQLLPSTAFWIADKEKIEINSKEDLFNPDLNIQLGCAYLKYLYSEFEDESAVLGAYNAGLNYVKNWLNDPNYSQNGKKLDTTPFNETNIYLKKIEFNKKIYKFCF